MSLNFFTKPKNVTRPTNLNVGMCDKENLIYLLLKQKWPVGFEKHLPKVVEKSWAAYTQFWNLFDMRSGLSSNETGRLANRLEGHGFLASPYFFIKWWMLTIIKPELTWRKGAPQKWAVWSPRHKLFLEAGRAETDAYCCDPARFDQLLKELLR